MRRFLSALALGASLSSPLAASAAPRTLHVGAATVTVTGSGPRAVILIPGLASGAYVFDAIVPQLARDHTVYAVTFAGFDGLAPVKPPYLDAFGASIAGLIAQEKLVKPILIGHSLGGHVALRFAATSPAVPAGVLVIDSIPLFPPPRPGETPESRKEGALAFRDAMLGATPEQYAAQTKAALAYLVTAPKDVDFLLPRDLASDRATAAGAIVEMALEDLTPLLGKITAPVEVLAPAATEADAAQTATQYASAYAGTPHLDVVAIAPSKHFIMYDQPEKFAAAVAAFVAKVTQ